MVGFRKVWGVLGVFWGVWVGQGGLLDSYRAPFAPPDSYMAQDLVPNTT